MKIFGYEKKFIEEVSRIKDPAIFFGIARTLKVPCFVDKDTPREFNDILEGIFDAYFAADLKRQKELLKILKDANECKENFEYGNNTKNSAKTIPNKKV